MPNISVLLFLLIGFRLFGQTAIFERITIEDGLSQGMIFDLLQTRDGFLWIATKDGLNRYDGNNFKVFSNDPFNPFSIAENTVTTLFEDSRGWLWVGTESKGLDLYDPRTERFHHFPMNFQEVFSGGGVRVNKIRETPDGSIWVMKFGIGLMHIAIPATWQEELPVKAFLEPLTQISPVRIDLKAPESDWLHHFFILENGKFLVASTQQLFTLDVENGHSKPVFADIISGELNEIAMGSGENASDFWIGDLKQQCNIRDGKAKVFTFPMDWDIQFSGLHPGKNGHVWSVINNRVWDLAPGEDLDFAKPDLVLDESPNCLISDKNGNLWFGTVGYGLRKYNPAKSLFHAGAAGVSIAGLWRSPTGKYYCKTRISFTSIFPYDPDTGQLGVHSAFPDAPVQHISLAFEPGGTTWLLCTSPAMNFQGMLRRYSATGSFTGDYTFDTKISLTDQMIRSKEGLLWIGGNAGQLVRFNPQTNHFDYFNFGHLFGEQASAVRSTALAEDGKGTLWVGTQLGLVKCQPGKDEEFDFQLIQADINNPNGLNNNSIACLLPDPVDPANILWIGTKGGGINRFDHRAGHFLHLTTDAGMPNNVVYGILPGTISPQKDEQEFWCSTNRGLAKITLGKLGNQPKGSPLRFEITPYTASAGLQDNEFNSFAYFKSDNGELLFGGVNGLNRFFPEELKLDTTPPPVYIVGLEINHQKVDFDGSGSPLSQPLEMLRELRLNHDQNNLSFEFAALDFTGPSKNRYRYQLVGLDKDWVENGHQRFAHFNHLPPGRYEFRVQGSNGGSNWADAVNTLTIIIMPPWWRSDLAYAGYILLLIWLAWRAYQFQIRRMNERQQLAFEQRETERVKAMEQMKTDFFSNVTHEFRTPLTLIIEPLRQLLKNPDGPGRNEKIRLAEKNSRRLLSLVNQLLDMAKLESGSMGVDLRRGDFGQTVRGVFETFLPLAAKRNIQLTLATPHGLMEFEFDPGKVELVLNNLISNALKFTPEGGRVKLDLGLKDEGKGAIGNSIFVSVTDNGIGIPEAAIGKIFDRFYQVDGSHTRPGEGTGIGLALSKELAELMGGDITVESQIGKGSTFTFWLPLQSGASKATVQPGIAIEPEAIVKTTARSLGEAAEGRVVLLVEDNAELRAFIKQSIEVHWQVLEASNGEEGIKKAIELLPDLVISDLMMPLKDGFVFCDEMKTNELTAHIPVILLTAKSAIESKLQGLRIGADDYLTKPFNTEELLARMENLVELRRKLRERYGSKPVAASNGDQTNESLSVPDRAFLKKFTLLLDQHLSDETLGVEDFAQKMFISRSQLHRKLKAITDRSATDFIKDYRLERAHAMLSNREGMVGEVAARVGFGNEKYFSTVFKEKFGVSPGKVG